MIYTQEDECYLYDSLSVAEIKLNKSGTAKAAANVERKLKELTSQIDPKIHEQVLASEEYAQMKRVNLQLFEMFDEIKRPGKVKCYDIEADELNYQRDKCKTALQTRFFPQSPRNEFKLGYENVK